MMIMNLDYYYTFRFYCNALLQQAALFPRHVDRFFLSGGDSTENAHMHTLARTQHTTHHSSKSISGFFFLLLFVLFVFWHTILLLLLPPLLDSAGHFVVLFQFRFVMLSIILLFFVAFIGYPGVKNSRFTKQRPIITKSIPLYGVQKQKTTEYPISPRTTQSAPMHFVSP